MKHTNVDMAIRIFYSLNYSIFERLTYNVKRELLDFAVFLDQLARIVTETMIIKPAYRNHPIVENLQLSLVENFAGFLLEKLKIEDVIDRVFSLIPPEITERFFSFIAFAKPNSLVYVADGRLRDCFPSTPACFCCDPDDLEPPAKKPRLM